MQTVMLMDYQMMDVIYLWAQICKVSKFHLAQINYC